jgi:hypothetical protein
LKHHIETLKKLLSSLTYFICGIDWRQNSPMLLLSRLLGFFTEIY